MLMDECNSISRLEKKRTEAVDHALQMVILRDSHVREDFTQSWSLNMSMWKLSTSYYSYLISCLFALLFHEISVLIIVVASFVPGQHGLAFNASLNYFKWRLFRFNVR